MAVIANAFGGGVSPLEFMIGPKLREAAGDVEPTNVSDQIAAAIAASPGFSRPPATHWAHFCGDPANDKIVDLPMAVRRCETCGVELPPPPPDAPSSSAAAPSPAPEQLERTQVGSPFGPADDGPSSPAAPGRSPTDEHDQSTG